MLPSRLSLSCLPRADASAPQSPQYPRCSGLPGHPQPKRRLALPPGARPSGHPTTACLNWVHGWPNAELLAKDSRRRMESEGDYKYHGPTTLLRDLDQQQQFHCNFSPYSPSSTTVTMASTALNYTSPDFDRALCTLETCPLSLAHLTYLPSIPWNAAYAAVFGLALLAQLVFGIRYKTWGYLAGAIGGLVLEIIGYVGRVQMHDDPFSDGPFIMSLCTLTIAPAFLSASIYLCLSRVVIIFGQEISYFKPRTYTFIFIIFDFVSLVLQAAGGAMASIANTQKDTDTGVNVMIAGLVWQVVSLVLFMAIASFFAWRVRKQPNQLNPRFESLRATTMFKLFLLALLVATVGILVRSVFRVAELSEGFDGKLANDQITFMILEGVMLIIVVSALTVFHPGLVCRENWHDAAWSFRRTKYDTMKTSRDQSTESIEMFTDARQAV